MSSSALAACMVFACASVPPCPERGGPDWWQLDSAHFHLRTDLDAEAAKTLLVRLEDTRAAMLAVWWRQQEGPPGRLPVIALRNDTEMKDVVGRRISGMWVRRSPFPGTMLIAGNDSKEGLRILSHELAHSLSRWFVPLQPPWYAEGLACVLESVRYDRSNKEAMVAMDTRVRYHDLLRSGLMKVNQVLSAGDDVDDRALSRFESSSWLLVQYLLQYRSADFGQFEGRLNHLESPQRAWAAAFGDLPLAQLDDQLYSFADRGDFQGLRVPLSQPLPSMQVRRLTDAEVHATLAFVYGLFTPENHSSTQEIARDNIQEALRHDPTSLEALALRFYEWSTGNDRQRALIASRAVQTHPDSWLAQVMEADAVGIDKATVGAALDRALVLAPDEPEVLIRVTIARLAQARWAEALTASSRAIKLSAVSPNLFIGHTIALARTGDCPAAIAYLQALPRFLPASALANLAREWPTMRGPLCPQVEMK